MNKKIVVLIPVYNPNEKIMEKFLDELSKNFENIVFIMMDVVRNMISLWIILLRSIQF